MALVVAGTAFHLDGTPAAPILPHSRQWAQGHAMGVPACGTWLCSGPRLDPVTRDALRVRAGTLDDTSWLRPTVHFWTRSQQPWVVLPEGDQRFETQPADLA